jgi:hypothetical protein
VVVERAGIQMAYTENSRAELDLSCAGRGLQQTLLLLTYMGVNPGAILLLDEPDAHLEFLRQRQLYKILTAEAEETSSQIIAASHSEVLLNEAADRDTVIAFVGNPHRVDDRGSQTLKALKSIGFEHYVQADQTGWVLFLEGSTDLAILRAFAARLGHPAEAVLERPYVHYVANQPGKALDHFWGLREARPDLLGFALYDNLGRSPPTSHPGLVQHMWIRREIENYLSGEKTLLRWVRADAARQLGSLFSTSRERTFLEVFDELGRAFEFLHGKPPWANDVKASDEFLNPLFKNYFDRVKSPNLFRKTDYHLLARYVEPDEIDAEVVGVLDKIVAVAGQARSSPLPG